MTAGAPNTCIVAAAADDDVLSVVLALIARLMYRNFPRLEVFRDFDKEDVVYSHYAGGF